MAKKRGGLAKKSILWRKSGICGEKSEKRWRKKIYHEDHEPEEIEGLLFIGVVLLIALICNSILVMDLI